MKREGGGVPNYGHQGKANTRSRNAGGGLKLIEAYGRLLRSVGPIWRTHKFLINKQIPAPTPSPPHSLIPWLKLILAFPSTPLLLALRRVTNNPTLVLISMLTALHTQRPLVTSLISGGQRFEIKSFPSRHWLVNEIADDNPPTTDGTRDFVLGPPFPHRQIRRIYDW